MENEIWKDIINYEGLYQVSNIGRVKRLKGKGRLNEKILIPSISYNGYYCVFLCKNSNKKRHTIHRLVLQTFCSINNNNLQVNHKDGIKLNNHIDNLEWCTSSQNHSHAYKLGLQNHKGENHPQHKLINRQILEIKKILLEKEHSQRTIAKMFNVSQTTISKINQNKMWVHIGA